MKGVGIASHYADAVPFDARKKPGKISAAKTMVEFLRTQLDEPVQFVHPSLEPRASSL